MTWLYGLVGSGKSTLLNSIAHHFSSLHQCGAFVFSSTGAILSMATSPGDSGHCLPIGTTQPIFCQENRFRTRRDVLRGFLYAQFHALLEEPSKAVAPLHHCEFVIHGLDECDTEKSREGLLEIFSRHIPKLPALSRILVASRDEKDITPPFLIPVSPMSLNQFRSLQMTTARQTTSQNILRQRLTSIAVVAQALFRAPMTTLSDCGTQH